MGVVHQIDGVAMIEVFIVQEKVQFKRFQARGLMKDGESDFKTFPECSLPSETSYTSIFHEQTFFFC